MLCWLIVDTSCTAVQLIAGLYFHYGISYQSLRGFRDCVNNNKGTIWKLRCELVYVIFFYMVKRT